MNRSEFAFLRVAALNLKPQGRRSLRAAPLHNWRLLPHAPNSGINRPRSYLNIQFVEHSADVGAVVESVRARTVEAGAAPNRRDALVAVEFVFSLRRESDVANPERYFGDCADWAAADVGGELIAADVHLDEACPHCHVIVLPPRTKGSGGVSKLIGGKPELRARAGRFHDAVGIKHGLPRQLSSQDRGRLAGVVQARIMARDSAVQLGPIHWPVMASIARDPEPYAVALNVDPRTVLAPGAEVLADLAVSTGKGAKTAAEQAGRDMRMMGRAAQAKRSTGLAEPLIEVGSMAAESASEGRPLSSVEVEPPVGLTHMRNADMDPADWDARTGAFIAPSDSRRCAA